MKRVFAAIDISEEVREEVRNYVIGLRTGFDRVPVKWVTPEKLHITVKFAGSVDDQQLRAFTDQIKTAAKTLALFQLKIARTGTFVKRRGARVLWLGTEALSPVPSDDPFAVLAGLNEKRLFWPHLTIARIKDPRKVKEMMEKHRSSEFESAAFQVRELAVYESILLTSGSVYARLESFPFG